ncbi:MAG: 50S ribosomal protein L10 [Pirellulales bacterium]
MSKVVKKFVTRDIANRLAGVQDAIVVNVVGLEANDNYLLRKTLREQGIGMLVVKQSLAARATEGTSLRAAFGSLNGSIAVVWGCEDFVALAKAITKLDKEGKFPKFEIKGGVMDGDGLTGDQVKAISKWPSRQEQISLLVGQILSPATNLVGQILGPSRTVAGQVKKLIENLEG